MSANRPDETLPPEAEARLSELLEAWAASRRLTAAQSAHVWEAVLEGRRAEPSGTGIERAPARPGELSGDWWRVLMDQVAATVVAARGNVGVLAAGLASVAWGLRQSPGGAGKLLGSGSAYRPYLRLAPVPAVDAGRT